MASETVFAPLPVRRRGTLEIVDTALKLYRRYLKVLLGWSLIVAATYLASAVIPFAYLLAFPLTFGSVACCVAAAVRGQKVTFSQVWEFTKPRYGALVGLFLLSMLIVAGIFLAIVIVGSLLFVAAAYLITLLPSVVGGVGTVVGVTAAGILYSILAMMAFVWQNVVLFVVCLEDDKRGTAALGRGWQLLEGHWKSAFGLSALLTIASFTVFGLIFALLAFFGQTTNVFAPDASTTALMGFMASAFFVVSMLLLFWLPGQTLVTAVLYLDLRVRKEALDLEWTAYSSATPTGAEQGSSANSYVPSAPVSTPNIALSPLDAATPSSFGATSSGTPTPSEAATSAPVAFPVSSPIAATPTVAPQVTSPPTVAPPLQAPPQHSGIVPNQTAPVSPTPPVAPPSVAPSSANSSFAPSPSASQESALTSNPFNTPSPQPSSFGGPSTTEAGSSLGEPSSSGSSFGSTAPSDSSAPSTDSSSPNSSPTP